MNMCTPPTPALYLNVKLRAMNKVADTNLRWAWKAVRLILPRNLCIKSFVFLKKIIVTV